MGSNSYPFRYTYTDLDHRASMRYPSNTLVNEVPNDLGWPTQLTGFTRSNSEILYHPNGTPKQITFVNSQTWATTLKPRQWIATIKGNNGSLLNLGYTYDLRGNLTSLSDTATGGQSISMQYDGVDRLTYASGPQPWGYERYYYENGRGDLTRRLSSNWTIHFSYNSSGQLTSTTAPLTASYRYDNRGNITEDANWRYAYNYAGELRAVYPQTVASWQPPASQWAYGYAYDANGKRVAKAVLGAGGRNEVSAYGQNGRLLLYDNDAHSGWREQVYLGDRLVAQRRSSGGVRTFYLTDALGSPRVASSAYGAVLWRENYRPWGQRNTKSADMQTDPLAYTAQPFDDETSLLYLGARYHHVKIGRFYQMDPVHFAEDNSHSFNRFAYANNNPYKFVDPEGLFPEPHDDVAYRQLGADQGSLGTEGRGMLFGGLAGAVGLAAIPARVLGAALVAGGPSLDLATMASGEPPLMGALAVPGRVQSRINIAKGRTRTTPLRSSGEPVSAGFDHVLDGHFNRALGNNRSVFSITPGELKSILQSKTVVNSPVTDIGGGQFSRTVDVGRTIGNASLKEAGVATSTLRVLTDRSGNLITTYPVR